MSALFVFFYNVIASCHMSMLFFIHVMCYFINKMFIYFNFFSANEMYNTSLQVTGGYT